MNATYEALAKATKSVEPVLTDQRIKDYADYVRSLVTGVTRLRLVNAEILLMLMAVVAMIHPGITALPTISGETVGIERVAGSVVLAVRVRIKLRAVPGILDDGLRSRWTCERRCQQRCAKYPCAKDCKFCHERPREVGFSGRRTPRMRACSVKVCT